MNSDDDLIGLMRLYLAIAESGGVGAGGRRIGLSQPAASRGLRRLEDRIGARLVERSTARLSLTEEGARFLQDARATLETADAAVERARAGSGELAGRVVVAANVGIAALALPRHLSDFRRRHPAVSIELRATDQPVAMQREGVDVWVRVGPFADQDLVARRVRLMPRVILVNAAIGAVDPADDAALAALPWIGFPPFYENEIALIDGGGRRRIPIAPQVTVDNVFALVGLLAAGPAAALLPRALAAPQLEAGAVRELAPELQGEPAPWWLLLKPGRYRPARVTALARSLAAGLSEQTG